MTQELIIKIRCILMDLAEKMKNGRNSKFDSYDLQVRGEERENVIKGLEKMKCISNAEKRGVSKVTMIADYEEIEKALKNKAYDNL